MNISDLSNDIIEDFGNKYLAAMLHFDIEPINAPDKKQKQICKWIYNMFSSDYLQKKNFKNYSELIKIMYECYRQNEVKTKKLIGI